MTSAPAQRLFGQIGKTVAQEAWVSSNAGMLARLGGGVAGGAVASAIFAYGAYAMGMADLRMANRSTFAGLIGTATGAAASATTIGLVTAYGTASTGTAIASLSGVAASNASLAWIGGGSVAAGGMGTTGGIILLSTGAGVVIVATTAAVMYGFYIADMEMNNKRVAYLIDMTLDSLTKSQGTNTSS